MSWYIAVLKKYVTFDGRARRKEYWMFALFNFIFAIVAMILDNVLGLANENTGYGIIYTLYGLAVLLPGLAVGVRRLLRLEHTRHPTDDSSANDPGRRGKGSPARGCVAAHRRQRLVRSRADARADQHGRSRG